MCDSAVQRVYTCLTKYNAMPYYLSSWYNTVSSPNWPEDSFAVSPCCDLVPLLEEMCQGRNLTAAVNQLASWKTGYDYAPANGVNLIAATLNTQINSCTTAARQQGALFRAVCVVLAVSYWRCDPARVTRSHAPGGWRLKRTRCLSACTHKSCFLILAHLPVVNSCVCVITHRVPVMQLALSLKCAMM